MATASDTFPTDSASLGANWATITGANTFHVTGGIALPLDKVSDGGNRYSATSFGANQFSQVLLSNVPTADSDDNAGIGVALRIATAAITYYRVVVNGNATGNTAVSKFLSGSWSQQGTNDTAPWVSGDTLRVEISGTTTTVIKIFRNGVQVGTRTDTTSPITSGQPGVVFAGSTAASDVISVDNWTGGDLTPSASLVIPTYSRRAVMVL